MNIEEKFWALAQSKYYLLLVSAGFIIGGLTLLAINAVAVGGTVMFEAGLFTAWAVHDLFNRHEKNQSNNTEESKGDKI